MSGTFTENHRGSFANGKKRYARCIDTYVDKYNAQGSGSASLTKGKIYEVLKEGDYHNSANAFKTYFKMIFIRDDNNNVWGLVEDMFDMDVEYASAYDVHQLRIKDANASAAVRGRNEDYPTETIEEDNDDYEDNSNYTYSARRVSRPSVKKPTSDKAVLTELLFVVGVFVVIGIIVLTVKGGVGAVGDFMKFQQNTKKANQTKVFK